MTNRTIKSLVTDCSNLSSEMNISYGPVAPSFVFTNTGRRNGTKSFSVTLPQLISVLENIRDNLAEFARHANYNESHWRTLFSDYIENDVVNALSAAQTLPLFALLNKIITVVTNSDYHEKTILLDSDKITQTIDYLKSQVPEEEKITPAPKPAGLMAINKIFYGAPGTGKSHKINELTQSGRAIRTVFHPDMQYVDFVGGLKPKSYKDEQGVNKITYEFRPGPFTRALIESVNHPEENVYLIIEEINRAQAPAVFGEIFQLLDRDDTGRSKYAIDIADPDMLEYINAHTKTATDSCFIPQNMSILATMNSSDQAVMPMDTAFKRRWQFEYILIDFNNASSGAIPVEILSADDTVSTLQIEWRHFAQIINQELKAARVPEDRLLGQRFLSDSELKDVETARETLASKVLVYLWDDVLRHGKKNTLFRTDTFNTFGDVYHAFLSGKPVFNADIEEKMILQSAQQDI